MVEVLSKNGNKYYSHSHEPNFILDYGSCEYTNMIKNATKCALSKYVNFRIIQ